MWPKALALTLLVVSITGCGSTTFTNNDVRLRTEGDTLYLLARSDGVSRGICASLGGDVARAEARWAADEGRTLQLGRVSGCYTVRHVIVCTDDNAGCLAHEEKHRSEGAFHP
jgi:hypothetical protein